ncbi:unnamed protein product, partial [Scytosiphon promiscuus]
MSLQFSEDPLSKREKQQLFKRSLDDQRRMKLATCPEQDQTRFGGNGGNHVPGLAASRDVAVPGPNRIPGLDIAPRFEGSSSLQQEKQPYMSALSEMNGRPLHVRQQQFQKESQYRNMLKDQIEENKKRKDAEKAKLDEEKRHELEEVRRLQGIPAPRRQQHAQFQESPDHPLPSPGRLPPARHNHAVAERQPRYGIAGSRSYLRPEEAIPARSGSTATVGNEPNNPLGVGDLGCADEWRVQQNAPDNRQGQSAGFLGRPFPDPVQVDSSKYPNDPAPRGRQEGQEMQVQAPHDTLLRNLDGYGGGNAEAGRPRGCLNETTSPNRGESAVRTSAFDRSERGATSATQEIGGYSDSVPRADFDELSSLCRDLLLEQKRLRQKLEEREERESLTAERSAQNNKVARQHRKYNHETHQQRQMPRRGRGETRGSGGIPSTTSDGKWHDPSTSGSAASRMRTDSVRKSAVGRDSKIKPKSAVAFGSTKSRMPSSPAGKPRAHQMSRGNRDPRVSKSEPVPRAGYLLDSQHLRGTIPTNGRSDGVTEKVFARHEAPATEWRRNDEGIRDTGGGTIAEIRGGSGWVSRTDENREVHRARAPDARDGNSPLDRLRGSGVGGRAMPSMDARAAESYDSRYGIQNGELDGESTFLAAHP